MIEQAPGVATMIDDSEGVLCGPIATPPKIAAAVSGVCGEPFCARNLRRHCERRQTSVRSAAALVHQTVQNRWSRLPSSCCPSWR
jgi:hypothetical protein